MSLQILVYYTNIVAIFTILVISLNLLVAVFNTICVIVLISCDVMRMKIWIRIFAIILWFINIALFLALISMTLLMQYYGDIWNFVSLKNLQSN